MSNNKSTNKKLNKLILIITLFIVTWVVFEVIIKGFDVVSLEYGINPKTFFAVFLIAEVFFDIGIAMIVLGSGALKLRWKHFLEMDFQHISLKNHWVYSGFFINRIAALVPPLYLLIAGWSRLPYYVTLLIIVEMIIIFYIASIPLKGKSRP